MPAGNSIAGLDPNVFFQNNPNQRLSLLEQMQPGEMAPHEQALLQLLQGRPDAWRPTAAPGTQPAQPTQPPGMLQALMSLLGGKPASDAMAQANAQYTRGR